MRKGNMRAGLAMLVLISAMVPRPLLAQASRFTLAEAWAIANRQNPRVQAMAAAADAMAAREPGAGRPPDPVFQVGAMNFAVPAFRADMPNSMVPALQVMQMVPFPGKLGLSSRIAEQSTMIAGAEAEESGWEVRSRVATVFFELYAVDRQIRVARETLALLTDFEQIARALYASGTGRQTDVLRAGVEAARMKADLARMEAMRKTGALRMNALLDRSSATPVPETAETTMPLETPVADTLRAWAGTSRAMLQAARTRVAQSGRTMELARREIWPDFTVGLQYGQRSLSNGTARMASVMLGFTVPVFAGSRQYRMREEAEAMMRMADAGLAEALAEVDAEIGTWLAELDRARTLAGLYRSEILPQAAAAVQSALSAYRVGQVDFLTLLDAQMAWNRYQQELHGLVADYGTALARLESVVGREVPTGGPALVEVR